MLNNHESMTPGSGSIQSPRSRNNAYLPAYLMGDSTTSLQSLKVKQQLNQSQPQTYFNFGPSAKSPKNVTVEKNDKPRAPPLKTLEESFHEYRMKQHTQDICPSPVVQNNDSFNFFYNSPRPGFTNVEVAKNEEDISDLWVTVFGFAPDSVPFILQEFGQLGLILKHFMPAEGNWIHLLYENKIQARRALSRSGRVYNGNMMIGVVPCTDKKTMDMHNKARNMQLNNTESFSSKAPEESFTPRNLTPSVQRKLPQRQNSIVNKALDFVFGW